MSEDIDAPSETDPSRAVMERLEEIAPCPHCGGTDVHVTEAPCLNAGGEKRLLVNVFCQPCSAGLTRGSRADAIAAWNRRASPAPVAGGWRPGPLADVHELKTWPEFYEAVEDERKPWELREYDRPYKVGDILHLREWRPHTERYTGRECWRGVTYLFVGDGGWLPKGKCIMGLARYAPPSTDPVPVEDGRPNLDDLVAAHVQQMTEVVIPQIEDDLKQQARSATRLRLDLPSTDPVPVGGDEHPTPDAAGELAALAKAEDLLGFYEGLAEPEFPGADPTVRINGEDYAEALMAVRQAASRLRSQGSE